MTDLCCATRPELVLFDLDGTLTDSAPGIVASFGHALAQVGAPLPDGDIAARIVGPPMHHTMGSLGLGGVTDPAMVAYREHYPSTGWAMNTPLDGIAELLADLRAAGIRLAVATSKAETTAVRILEHFCFAGYFEVIAGASVDGTRSAKADVVAHALAQLGPLPERVLMVGDRSHDVEGAAAHGIDTVVVGWGYGASDFGPPAGQRGSAEWTGAQRAAAEPRRSWDRPDSPTFQRIADVAGLREVLGV